MSRHTMIEPSRPTEAEAADRLVRQHLTVLLYAVQEGNDADVARLARAEVCRLVSAICAALHPHRLHPSGSCAVCGSPDCALRAAVRRALLPVRLP